MVILVGTMGGAVFGVYRFLAYDFDVTAGVFAVLMFIAAMVCVHLLYEPARKAALRKWWLAMPGQEEASGPYSLKVLAQMWGRGVIVPGTQVRSAKCEWMDVA